MLPTDGLNLYISDLSISIDNLDIQEISEAISFSDEDWAKLVWLHLKLNRNLVLKNICHKASNVIFIDNHTEYTETFILKAFDQLYQLIKDSIMKESIDPKDIRGMAIDKPNNLYVYYV